MLGILNSVLDINQIEAGMVEPQIVSFAIGDLLGRLFKEFYYPAQAAGLQLHVVPSSLAVRTDPRLFEQIVRNLLSNALKYTTSGKILVGCRRRGTKVRFEVWDTGIGIPENHIEDVFRNTSSSMRLLERKTVVWGWDCRSSSGSASFSN